MMTGYWGVPGSNRDNWTVHIELNGKPWCSARIHPDAEFQWCSTDISIKIVECNRCKEKYAKHLRKKADSVLKSIRRKKLSWL